jgi:hypothetical protein
MVMLQFSHGLALISSCKDQREAISEKALSCSRLSFLISRKSLQRNLSCKGHSQVQRFSRNHSRAIDHHLHCSQSQRLAHEAKAEVTFLALQLLIFFWAEGVITGEVEAAQGSTHPGHELLELLLLLLAPEVVLLLVITLVAGVLLVGAVVLIGGVKLLPLRAVDDDVGGVIAHEAVPMWSPPLLAELVQGSELAHQ